MKKTLAVITLLAGAGSAYSQGTVNFFDYSTSFRQQFFSSQTLGASTVAVSYGGYSGYEEMGSTAAGIERPKGTTVYATGALLSGTGFDAQLLAAPGLNDALVTLLPTGPVVHFFTGSVSAGLYLSGGNVPIPGTTPGNGSSSTATVAVAVWANNGIDGAADTLAQAQADGYAWGVSNTGNLNYLGGWAVPVPWSSPDMPSSITSFSMIAEAVPEPGTIVLGVLGASAFLFRRRE